METTEFDRARRRQLHSTLVSLASALWEVDGSENGDRSGPLDVASPVLMALRAAGHQPAVVRLVEGILKGTASHEEPQLRETLEATLRLEGYRAELINLVGTLLDRFGGDVPGTGLRPRDVFLLLEYADEDLLQLLRLWNRPAWDPHVFGAMFVTLLGRRGVPREVAQLLAAVVNNAEGDEGQLEEIARISRYALTAEDSCISIAEPAWLEDPRFERAYAEAKGISAWGRDIRWRVQTVVKAAAVARHLEGDFVECGVDTGGTARAVMAYLGDAAFADRTFYLFDTFRGMVVEQLQPDEPAPIEGRFPDVYDIACENFADKSYVQIVRGVVPDTLPDYTGSQVAYLHIDMNAAHPEVEALKFFWDRLAPGAPVVFDDYGFPRHRAQRIALDKVADSFGVEIMMLPTCQGLLYKPPSGT